MTVIDVVLFGNSIQSIDARITSFQSFFQSRPRSHVLITGPVKFDPRLVSEVSKVQSPTALLFLDPLAATRFSPSHTSILIWKVCPTLPNLVTFERQSSWPWGISSLFFWDCIRLRRRRLLRCHY